ncbi:MAG: hypothetical protein U0744_06435 [Gemmataceae bacterium]
MRWVRRGAFCCFFAALSLMFSVAKGQDDTPERRETPERRDDAVWSLEPGTSQFKNFQLRRGQQATFVCYGSTTTARLGVYVYDNEGNCIAFDDIGSGKAPGVVVADFTAGATGNYQVELHNLGTTSQNTTLLKTK